MVAVPSEDLLRWIPLLPLLAAAIHGALLGFWRRPLSRGLTILLSCGAPILSFLLSCFTLWELVALPEAARALGDGLFTWIGAGDFSAEAALLADPLSVVMAMVVTGVGSAIHIYSIAYMDDDPREDGGFQRFFCYMNLFLFAMLVLVLADNLLLTFLGWEGVGLCSYLLIGFWFADDANARAGAKAFIVNRIGDFGFLVGTFLLFWALAQGGHHASLGYRELQAALPRISEQLVALPAWLHWLPGAPDWKLTTVIGLCFFLAAAGKSAQLPLYVWLPDAMAGPTPVSALIHAATMVTAGVYLMCRLSFLFVAAPGASAVVAWVGVTTAAFAALIAVAQTDIKKVLAYSTISQLGYMFLAVGCGAYSAAIFHVVTHAFFKALLFLGAGSVILALHHEQDMDRMGGLRRFMPVTHWTFAVAVAAISGFPFFSGWFSKDAILLSAWLATDVPGHTALYGLGLGTAGLTAFYMCRLHFRIFLGPSHVAAGVRDRIHEPNWLVLGPLVALAVLAFLGGWLGPPAAFNPFPVAAEESNSLGNFLAPVLQDVARSVQEGTEWHLAGFATSLGVLGAALALWLYVLQPLLVRRIARGLGVLRTLVQGRFFVDEIYDRSIVRPLIAVSDRFFYRTVDARWIDGWLVNGSAQALRFLASGVLRYLQSGFAQAYLLLMAVGAAALVGWLAR